MAAPFWQATDRSTHCSDPLVKAEEPLRSVDQTATACDPGGISATTRFRPPALAA